MAVPMLLLSEDSYRPIRMMKTSNFPPGEVRAYSQESRRGIQPHLILFILVLRHRLGETNRERSDPPDLDEFGLGKVSFRAHLSVK